MSLEALLDHECDIYHLVKTENNIGYGLPKPTEYSYAAEPDEASIPCHFGVNSFNHSTTQNQPENKYEARIKLTLPLGTDIRQNDKIVSLVSGYEYIAEIPRNIRNHHLFVFIKRINEQKPL